MSNSEYAQLRELVRRDGLLEKKPLYYVYKNFFNLTLLAVCLTVLMVVNIFWIQLLDAIFLAFIFGQVASVGHDAGHNQISRSMFGNKVMIIASSFFIGISRSWWVEVHNEHHANPNDLDKDPNTRTSILAFSKSQAEKSRGFQRFLLPYQCIYFIPLFSLNGLGMKIASIQFLFREKKVGPCIEQLSIMALHFALYFGFIFSVMNVSHAIMFIVANQVLFGLYTASIFAPNHKGMLIVDNEMKLDFLRSQVLTSRNITPSWFISFWYGGLNFQIEHHLFPSMPRYNLGKARLIVKDFCERHGVSYCETSFVESWKQIFGSLRQAITPLRSNRAS